MAFSYSSSSSTIILSSLLINNSQRASFLLKTCRRCIQNTNSNCKSKGKGIAACDKNNDTSLLIQRRAYSSLNPSTSNKYINNIHNKLKYNLINLRNMATTEGQPIIPIEEAKRFMRDCLEAVGTPRKHAEEHAALLAEADYRGHYSHGMNRLEMYVNDITAGTCDGKATPSILKESPATAWVDGNNGLGAVIGNFCMDLAMKKAKEVGIGMVVAKGSNHYGIAGMYTLRAIENGLLGMSFTNTSPFMTPTRAKEAALGTNPLSLGAPGLNQDSFVLDMATTAVAVGKVEIQRRKNAPIPEGWAIDEHGSVTTNADVAFNARRLMPLGGDELHSGFKGFGLGCLVEIMCGILGGSNWGPHVRKWGSSETAADLGQCFIAINPSSFAPGFEERMQQLMDHIRNMQPADPSKPVMVAGDPERNHMAQVKKTGGVRYVPNQMETCKNLAQRLKVTPLKGL